jgi:hypothetical protein
VLVSCEIIPFVRAVRANRDSGVTVDDSDDQVILRLRGHKIHRQLRDENRAGLKHIQRRAQQYEPWQRGLLQMAGIWQERAAHEDRDEKGRDTRRLARRQERARAAARTKRRCGRASVPQVKTGRPSTVASSPLLHASVNAHRNFHVSYRKIAEFLVDTVARRLSPKLRCRLLGDLNGPRPLQEVRLAMPVTSGLFA